jgi:RecA-family ATPase
MSDHQTADAARAELDSTPVYEPDQKKANGYAPSVRPEDQANGHAAEAETSPLRPRTMAALDGLAVPPMHYVVGEWVPHGKAVLLSGRGGGGKTTLACQLGAAHAIGAPFLGMPVASGTTLALLCEEDADDAHRMLARHAEHFERGLGEFASFHYLPRAGEDNALVARTSKGAIVTTPLHGQLEQLVGDLKATLLLLDNARHVARVNENDGAEVTAAWGLLHRLMRSTGGATVLLGHTPKAGNAEFSGNAAWENVARARLFLGPAKPDGDGELVENDPRRVLRRGKSNADGTGSLDLIWERGAFRLEHPEFATFGDRLDRELLTRRAAQAFLDALDALTGQRRAVSHKQGTNFAPKVMKDAGLADGFTKDALARAMNLLFRENRIIADQELWRGKDRHRVFGLARRACP